MKRIFILLMTLFAFTAYGADVKISNLPEATTLADTDVFPVVAGTTTSKVQVTNLKTILATHNAITLSSDLGANLLGLSTQQLTLDNQTANYVFAGPTTGSAAAPSFRALVAADIPSLVATYQPLDGELTALAGLTSAADAIPYFTGSGTAGVISSSADIVSFLGSADNAAALTALGSWGVSGSITDEQLICSETTGGTNLLKSCGAKTTINAAASTLLCKDSAGEVEACGGVTISGTTSPIVNVNPQEVDGHTTSTDLTAAQVSNTVIHNIGQDGNTVLILPTAAAGYSFLVNIGEADAGYFGVEAGASDAIYLIAAAGTVAAGADGAGVVMTAAQVGQSFACWTFKHTDDYDWMCKAISIGTSTFEAHASTE